MRNPNIRRPGETSEYSPVQIADLKRCMVDPAFFFEAYVKIKHPMRGLVPFKLHEYQKRLLDALMNHDSVVALYPRQTGKCLFRTTTIDTMALPTGIRRWVLKIIDRGTYDDIFGIGDQEEGSNNGSDIL